MSYNKETDQLVSVVMNKHKVDTLDEIGAKLDVKRGYIIRRLVDEGVAKYYSTNKDVVGSSLDPLSI